MTWVFLQYLLGFRRLGWDVLFLDWVDRDWCVDSEGNRVPLESSVNAEYIAAVMRDFGLEENYCLLEKPTERTVGVSRADALDAVRSSAAFVNVMGYVDDEEILAAAPYRVFLDIDPGFGQMWRELGLARRRSPATTGFVTIGENIGKPRLRDPDLRPRLDHDPAAGRARALAGAPNGARRASPASRSWRGPYGPVEYDGQALRPARARVPASFVELPRLTGQHVRARACDIDPAETRTWSSSPTAAGGSSTRGRWPATRGVPALHPAARRRSSWWPRTCTSRRGAAGSATEASAISPAASRSWHRTPASTELYPLGEGLLTFSTLDEAVAGVEEIAGDYDRHARAAAGSLTSTSTPTRF